MPEISTDSFKMFSTSGDRLLVECQECGKVLKVPRRGAQKVAGGFSVAGGVLCPCGFRSSRIESPPPKPQAPGKPTSRGETVLAQGLVWGVLAALVLGVGYVLVSIFGAFRDFAASEPPPDLTAEVRLAAGQVHVTNNDSFDWIGCSITLNAGLGGSWSQDVARISAGQTVSGGLMAFTRGRGERFNPLTHAVQDVMLMCSTPDGLSVWTGRF